ncbi:hypothetical protein P8C59_005046 [Phyllachora maydis]|uniref:Uncharacterized protein n=1 Tax=Phyllachora maydis TaxID=1825666 RepID=A0AAD9MF42_9PEZI|nr:hypothetical protein P8C59_005046 [Phyllachora maydis]
MASSAHRPSQIILSNIPAARPAVRHPQPSSAAHAIPRQRQRSDGDPPPAPFAFRRAVHEIKQRVVAEMRSPGLRAADAHLLGNLKKEFLWEVEMTILGEKLGHGERTLSHFCHGLAVALWQSSRVKHLANPWPTAPAYTNNSSSSSSSGGGGAQKNGKTQPTVRQVLHTMTPAVLNAHNLQEAVARIEKHLWAEERPRLTARTKSDWHADARAVSDSDRACFEKLSC